MVLSTHNRVQQVFVAFMAVCILMVSVSVVFLPSTADAQSGTRSTIGRTAVKANTGNTVQFSGGDDTVDDPVTSGAQTKPTKTTVEAAKKEAADKAITAGKTTSGEAKSSVTAWVGNIILTIPATLTWIGGKLLDMSVDSLIRGMGKLINQDSNIGFTVNTTWKVIRDIANIAFIFGFIWIGIQTIIDHEKAGTKKMLVSIIVGALLINFSLFFTKVIIDVSNVFAVEIYSSLGPTDGAGIATHFMDQMKLGTIYNTDGSFKELAKTIGDGSISYYVGAAIFLFLAGFVFAAGAFLIIIRFVALILIMIFSPVLFAASVFPSTAKYAAELWKKLFSYALFGPLYLLSLLISLQLIQGAQGSLGNGDNFFKALTNQNSGGGFGVILFFTIIIIFLTLSLKISQALSIAGGDKAVGFVRSASRAGTKFAGGATLGLGARLGRSTAGRLGNRLSNSDRLKDSNKWGSKQLLKTSNVIAGTSFDARQIGRVGKALHIGEGKKGGYTGRIKDAEKKEQALIKQLGTVGDKDVGVLARKNEVDNLEKQIREEKQNREGANTPEEKKTVTKNIQNLEKKLEQAKQNVEREKNRRLTGTTFAEGEIAEMLKETEKEINIRKTKISDLLEQYNDTSNSAERKEIAGTVSNIQNEIKGIDKAHKEAVRMSDMKTGYLDTIESRGKGNLGWLSSTFQGRNRGINTTVANKLKIEHNKKIKKTKADKSTDAIVSEIKNSNKEKDS